MTHPAFGPDETEPVAEAIWIANLERDYHWELFGVLIVDVVVYGVFLVLVSLAGGLIALCYLLIGDIWLFFIYALSVAIWGGITIFVTPVAREQLDSFMRAKDLLSVAYALQGKTWPRR